MDLVHEFNKEVTTGKVSQGIWNDFAANYRYVTQSGFAIRYKDRDFRNQGIPTYRQIIAWKELIRMMGEENFCTLPFELNYLRKKEVLFFDKFNEMSHNSKNLEITFVCGYFSRFTEQRRYDMVNFVVDNMLNKGYTVKIWTQDDTLKKEIKERIKQKELDADLMKKLHIRRKYHRFDIHYTLIEDKDSPEKSFIFMELPHTEAYNLRLETYFNIDELSKSFNFSTKKFRRILNYHRRWNPLKSACSLCNIAINI